MSRQRSQKMQAGCKVMIVQYREPNTCTKIARGTKANAVRTLRRADSTFSARHAASGRRFRNFRDERGRKTPDRANPVRGSPPCKESRANNQSKLFRVLAAGFSGPPERLTRRPAFPADRPGDLFGRFRGTIKSIEQLGDPGVQLRFRRIVGY